MKTLLLPLLLLVVAPAFSQKIIQKTLPYTSGQLVDLNLRYGDSIQVRYWDKPDVSIRVSVLINNGKLNDALLVETSSTDQALKVSTDFDQKLLKQANDDDCPYQSGVAQNRYNGNHNSVCLDIDYQVILPRNARLKIETISGNIDIKGASEAVSAKTISGYVDMSWPTAKGVNLAMKTITGEVYSDLDIDFKGKKQKNPIVGYLLEGAANGGGPTVRLESISNNIYLRKAK
ncbi:hypothetical protein J2I47_23790 [Fibrella sp. HMF5335]|uniref:DUF4097 domain-containing protein n=1 Tax=Fibrella rubiginis TaxID=2817060 RepID=A0A939K759_9BACT|nr:hypothetical protein [Fibrella rubiginis]MBO0939593.1 hypothetical protein [Fibrella rubiginis]